MKKLILLVISSTFLLSCNQSNKAKEKQSIKDEQVNKTVSLSILPNVFKLSEIPDAVTLKMTNNTDDTITTGLHYQIENYEKNERKEISPKNIVFNYIGWRIKPATSENFKKELYKAQINYKAGKYRIVKYYLKSDYKKTKEDFNVYAEFEVK